MCTYYCDFFPGPSFEPEIARCQIITSPGLISAECTFPNDTMATGFQMIAQSSNSSEVHKLHTNQSIDFQTPVTVEVEESGTYQVTIFATREEMGIVGSYVGYTGQVQVVVGDVTSDSNTTEGKCLWSKFVLGLQ